MYNKYLKRLFDIVLSILAFPFVAVVVVLSAPVIYFTDKGPVFYNAYRLGRNGKNFKMFKLRTMKVNSPDIRNVDGSTFNGENDPRQTKCGKFFRKTSIDEIPQFLNVLVGDMSLVGPRPVLATNNVNDFDDVQLKIISVRPGITGYVQAYFRNSIGQAEKFEKDLFYVEHMNFLFDLKIVFKTIEAVIKREKVFVEQSPSTAG
ncbi:MAG: sugar transferase [Bacteroidota bacterium]|nr:sugar transferase [Bacteroidota bacterium]